MAPDRLVESGPICDSWADSPTGVQCTAEMTSTRYPLSLFTSALPGVEEDAPYSTPLVATGGRPGYTYSVVEGERLPSGLALNPETGVLSGKPTVTGTFPLTFRVTDSAGPTPATVKQTLTITITPRPISIRTTRVAPAAEGGNYCRSLSAHGGTPPDTWTLTGGALPAGLSLDTHGSLQGTPSVTGTFDFTVTVTDSFVPADTATANLSLQVIAKRVAAVDGGSSVHSSGACPSG